jgi:hypothetical protein
MILNHRIADHFSNLAGGYSGTLNDTMKAGLVADGYSGTVNDMLQAYLRDIGYGPVLSSSFKKFTDFLAATDYDDVVAYYRMTETGKPVKGTGSVTVTRASSATGGDGITEDLVAVGNNTARYRSGKMLVEETRVNQVTYATPTAAQWSDSSTGVAAYSQSVETCKGRTGTAAKVTIGDVSGGLSGINFPAFAAADSAAGTASLYVRAGNCAGKVLDLLVLDFTATSPKGDAQITLTDEPQRVTVTTSALTAGNIMIIVAGYANLLGGASTLEDGDYFYVDVGQFETGESATSPILTSGAAATRLMDVPTIDVANMPAYSADYSIAMTLYAYDGSSNGHGLYSIDGETTRRAIIDGSDHKLYTVHPNATASTNVMPHSQPLRIVTSVDVDVNVNTYVNGVLESTTAAAAFSGTATAFYVGTYLGGTQSAHGLIGDLKTYSKALSATEALYA